MKRVEISNISSEIGHNLDFFICSASFESRCVCIAEAIGNLNEKMNTVIFVSGDGIYTQNSLEKMRATLPSDRREVRLSLSSPMATADAVSQALGSMLVGKSGRALLDVTTFTHEQLLIVIRYLNHLVTSGTTDVTFEIVYTGATNYGHVDNGGEMWLSRGVREIRPVLGFSGRFKTGLSTQLIMLVGFEHDRARAAVEYLEPEALSLGIGHVSTSISAELAEMNRLFGEKLLRFVTGLSATFPEVQQFEVSLIDPKDTRDSILRIADPVNFNVIVCPMNTKISTLGAAMAVLSDPRIQLLYVEPIEYNEKGYSIPSSAVRFGPAEFR